MQPSLVPKPIQTQKLAACSNPASAARPFVPINCAGIIRFYSIFNAKALEANSVAVNNNLMIANFLNM
jgi:hypothetical protein